MGSRRILIVEDDDDLRHMMAIRVRREGHVALEASCAQEALHMALAEVPDLLLLDLGLPGEDGYWLLARLKANHDLAHIPVIVVSGYPADIHRPRSLAAGAVAFLASPADWPHLKSAIDLALSASPGRREHLGGAGAGPSAEPESDGGDNGSDGPLPSLSIATLPTDAASPPRSSFGQLGSFNR